MKTKMMKKDVKAWLKIVEAVIAILIIMGVVLVIISRQSSNTNLGENIYETQRNILNIISKNNTLRGYVLKNNIVEVNNAILKMIPANWDYAIEICDLDSICNSAQTPNDEQIYTTEIIITSTLTQYSPRKLRFFVW